jgi:hypothetical protein
MSLNLSQLVCDHLSTIHGALLNGQIEYQRPGSANVPAGFTL